MLDNGARQEMLRGLHHGLSQVASDARETRRTTRMPKGSVANVGVLNEIRIDPENAQAQRAIIYNKYNTYEDPYIPEISVIEKQVAEHIAKHRTERVAASLAPVAAAEVVLVENPSPRVH